METTLEARESLDAGPATGGKIYCANCIHCKLVPSPAGGGRYYLRVRCEAGKWRKKLGEEKIYKYFTVRDAYHDTFYQLTWLKLFHSKTFLVYKFFH